MCVLAYFTYEKSTESSMLIIDTLQVQREGDLIREKDIENNAYINNLAHTLGLKTGVLIGSVTMLIAVIFGQTIIMLFGMRKEKLLITYYDSSNKTNK